MLLASAIINIFLLTSSPEIIRIELSNPEIPWFRSSELMIGSISGEKRNCPEWKNLYKEIEITEKPVVSGNENGCNKKFIIDPIKSGRYLIPSAVIKNKDGKEWKTSAFVLNVREPTDQEKEEVQKIAEIIEPEPKVSYSSILMGIIIGILLCVIVAGFVYYYQKFYRKGKTSIEKVELPWEKAFRRLRDLKSKDLPSQGLYEPYYVQLTWILRYYIEDRFHIHAPEQTTQEFIETTMKEKILTDAQQKLLYSFLKHCDKVKFAQFVPTLEQMEAGYNLVWNFVEETRLKGTLQEDSEIPNKDRVTL